MIIISILKVIGITLLVILGTLVVLLLLVLFVPFVYKANGYRKEGMDAYICVNARVSWLFRLVRVIFTYPGKPQIKVKLLFFTIYNSERKEKKKLRKTQKNKGKDSGEKKEDGKKEKSRKEERQIRTLTIEESVQEEVETASDGTENTGESSKTPFFKSLKEKIISFFEKIRLTILEFCAKIKNANSQYEKLTSEINYYIGIWNSEECQRALALCVTKLKRILKSIMPKVFRLNLVIGTGDPASLAKILEIYSIIYPYVGKTIIVIPDFDNSVIYGDFLIRGRVTSWIILWNAFRLYRDRNIRKVIAMFRKD
ncbi:MAG: hypothetical protein FWC09_05290 [Lachnospiraceae bacterium]|nr:hypothetical protein [Lachnospiraceae bacterium]